MLSTLAKSPTAIQDLLAHDELIQLRQTNPSFRLRKLQEAPICFPPTYKYDHNSSNYDTSPKQRVPSWCDRILWKSMRKESVKCIAYGRYEADVSDHRVSRSFFSLSLRPELIIFLPRSLSRLHSRSWSGSATLTKQRQLFGRFCTNGRSRKKDY